MGLNILQKRKGLHQTFYGAQSLFAGIVTASSDIIMDACIRHKKMFIDLDMQIAQGSKHYARFETMVEAHLGKGEISRCNNIMDLLAKLETSGKIRIGEYAVLKEVFSDIGHIEAVKLVEKAETEIKMIMIRDRN